VTYLIDTSALIRVARGQVLDEWNELIDRGLVSICDPVLVETLNIADAKEYDATRERLERNYPWVPLPEDGWAIIRSMGSELAKHSVHQAFSVADYLIAATAVKRGLTVLHEDRDFETASQYVPMLLQQRISNPPPTEPR
jgi:predicted nucleic acid-binding protein